jgi:N-acetylglucosaminyldiphosphoundecaprenol N-acetyl-beta-D-mannosaminyltransferase
LFIFGFHQSPFLRLARYAGQLKEKGYDVFVQSGYTKLPKDIPHSSFLSYEEMSDKVKDYDLIVCHAGTGSIMTCLFNHKKPIVVPRYKELKEHVDNHQLEICSKLGSEKMIEVVYAEESITDKIESLLQDSSVPTYQRGNDRIRTIVTLFFESKLLSNQVGIQKVSVLNCKIDNYHSITEVLDKFDKGIFLSANVHMVMMMQKNREFLTCYQASDYCINDSQIIYVFSKLLKTPLMTRISGADFLPAFCEYHKNNSDVTIFLLGSKEGVAKIAQTKINKKTGRKIVVGEYSPPFGFEKSSELNELMTQRINSSGANVLVVGLSAPKGEIWVFRNRERLKNIKRFLCIGAAIDFEAGIIRRAPIIFRTLGLEWLFRVWMEPRRLCKRYFIEDMPFIYLFTKQLLGKYRNPFIND